MAKARANSQPTCEGMSVPTYPIVGKLEPPIWLDRESLARGQKFARDTIFAVSLANLLSLIFGFAEKKLLEVLIFTQRSGCIFTSFKRYLSTILRVQSWYDSDILDPSSEGSRNLATVRKMHTISEKTISSANAEELKERTTLEKPLSNILSSLRADLSKAGVGDFIESKGKPVHINQWQMALTQFTFAGLMVMYPEKLGVSNASKEDLEGFVHLWAVIGHYLGIKDEYNWCLEGMDSLRERGFKLMGDYLLPIIKNANEDWEHMSRVMSEGVRLYAPAVSFETSLLYFLWMAEVPTDNLWKVVSWKHKCTYLFTRVLLKLACYFPILILLLNRSHEKGVEKARQADSKWLNKVKEETSLYEKKFI